MTPARNVLFFHPVKCTLLHFQPAAAAVAISWKLKAQQGNMGKKYFWKLLLFLSQQFKNMVLFNFNFVFNLSWILKVWLCH